MAIVVVLVLFVSADALSESANVLFVNVTHPVTILLKLCIVPAASCFTGCVC